MTFPSFRILASLVLIAPGAVFAIACNPSNEDDGGGIGLSGPRVPISSQGAALTAQENTEQTLRGVLNAGGFLAESAALADSSSSLWGDTTDLTETRRQLHEALDEFVQFLRDEIFISANLESDDGTYSVYLLPVSVFCGDGGNSSGQSDSTGTGAPIEPVPPPPALAEPPSQCETTFAKLEPRLRLSSPGAGDVDVELLLTSSLRNPLVFRLYDDRLGVLVDLGELHATLRAIGEDLEGLKRLDGKLELELVRHAALDYSIRQNVLQDLVLVAGDPGEEIEVMLAASSPTSELRLNGEARTVTGTLNYGALNVNGPLSAFMGETYDDSGNVNPESYTGIIDAVLGGLNGSLTFDGNTDALDFRGLGLGDVSTTIKHDGATLLELDLNPDNGRRFDLRVESAGAESAQLTFSPTLDLRSKFAFSHLSNQIDDIPTPLLDDTIRVWFEGQNPSIVVGEDGQLRVVSGTLHLDSQSTSSANLTVAAGMCLFEAPETEQTPSSFTTAFTAGICQ